jgi:multidrug efflux pump subunit AcrA (membrane-fusion protein)
MKISRSSLIKTGAAIAILGVGILVMQLLASTKAETNKRDVEPPVRKVDILMPVFGDISYFIEGYGMIESSGSLDVYSTISGKVVYSLNNLISGTFVLKDDILLKVDSRQAENSLNLAKAELIKAVASLVPQFKTSNNQLYIKWNNYLSSLNFDSSVSPDLPPVADTREKLLISTYGIYTSYYNVKNAEIFLEQHTIKSSFDGYISGSSILPDSFVNQGQKLFTLVDAGNLRVSVPLTVDDLNQVDSESNPSVKIQKSGGNGIVLEGRMVSRDMLMDYSSQMVNVYIEFHNETLDPRFSPGNYVEVIIEGRPLADTAAIPRYALIDNAYVYTLRDNILGKENVSIQAISNDTVFIGNTIPEGTQIITTILQKPLIGMQLSAMNGEAEDTNGVNDEKDS